MGIREYTTALASAARAIEQLPASFDFDAIAKQARAIVAGLPPPPRQETWAPFAAASLLFVESLDRVDKADVRRYVMQRLDDLRRDLSSGEWE